VNKQEFNASSWRSNQGYTKMHGQPTIKIAQFSFILGMFPLNLVQGLANTGCRLPRNFAMASSTVKKN